MASYASVRVAKVPTIAPSFHWSTTATLHFFIGLHRRLINSPMPRAQIRRSITPHETTPTYLGSARRSQQRRTASSF